MFSNGEVVSLLDGRKVKIVKLLGQGGQGAVYDVIENGKHYALKWYLPEYLKQIDQKKFYDNLKDNYKAGAPSSEFLWILALSPYKKGSFGYLMDLRQSRFSGFNQLLNARKKFSDIGKLLKAAKGICFAFQKLHSKGYSYQDINDGNFFVDVDTGDILICDNDNVAPYGVWMGMIGKDRYMAPEVVLGKKHPSMETDLYSLSVVLFMMFFISHPLEGAAVHSCPCLTTKYVRKLYAEKAVFVYDPVDKSNRPVMGIDKNVITLWNYYPEKIKNLFMRAFTDGLYKASYRVRENEWIDCFEELENSIVVCPHCHNKDFYSESSSGEKTILCTDCGKKFMKPFVFRNKRLKKVLNIGDNVLEKDIDGRNDVPVATVVESKKHKGLLGLKNVSDWDMVATIPDGKEITVGKGQVIPLFAGNIIKVNNQDIKIEF